MPFLALRVKINEIEQNPYILIDLVRGVDFKQIDIKALELGIINENQVDMLNRFYSNPDESMRSFLISHPEFLENALQSDEKTRKRAQLLIDGDLYGLNNK